MARFEDKLGFSYNEARKRFRNNSTAYKNNPNLKESVLRQVERGEGSKAADALRKEFK